jgi:4'-phosphopantetheinyl transferase
MWYESVWQTPSGILDALDLPTHEVHVWRASLARSPEEVERLMGVLAEDERARAARFHFAHDARRFGVGRALLRVLLSRYTQVAAEKVQFQYSQYGKPVLAGQEQGLYFNLSHSHEMALYAFSVQQEPGIDIEFLRRPIPDAVQLAKRFFSAQEYQLLASLPLNEVPAHFFRMWVRTEAVLKAQGIGLSGLDHYTDVGFGEARPGITGAMAVYELQPAPDYVAALALPKPVQQVVYWEL